MARKLLIEYAGAAYHVMARGNQGGISMPMSVKGSVPE